MKYDFSKVEIIDIEEGKTDLKVHEDIGNLVYRYAKDLDLVEKGRTIYKGEAVELDKIEVEEIITIINDPKYGLFAFTRKAIKDYIDDVKANDK